jgi:hypothetical protein
MTLAMRTCTATVNPSRPLQLPLTAEHPTRSWRKIAIHSQRQNQTSLGRSSATRKLKREVHSIYGGLVDSSRTRSYWRSTRSARSVFHRLSRPSPSSSGMDFHDASCVGIICPLSDNLRLVGAVCNGRFICNRSLYQNHCFLPLGLTLQRRHLAGLKSRPGAVPESTDFGLLLNAPEDHLVI